MSYSQPQVNCPYCNSICDADWVDVGIGMVQCGPYYCTGCRASQIGPHDTPRKLSLAEEKTGWYAPGEPVSDKANTFKGKLVNHQTAKQLYRAGLLDRK